MTARTLAFTLIRVLALFSFLYGIINFVMYGSIFLRQSLDSQTTLGDSYTWAYLEFLYGGYAVVSGFLWFGANRLAKLCSPLPTEPRETESDPITAKALASILTALFGIYLIGRYLPYLVYQFAELAISPDRHGTLRLLDYNSFVGPLFSIILGTLLLVFSGTWSRLIAAGMALHQQIRNIGLKDKTPRDT